MEAKTKKLNTLREQIKLDYLAQQETPRNTITRDWVLATIDYIEKVDTSNDTPEPLLDAIDDLARASAACTTNLVFRLYGIDPNTEAHLAIQLLKHMQKKHEYHVLQMAMAIAQEYRNESKKR